MVYQKVLILGPDYYHFVSAVKKAFISTGRQAYMLAYSDYTFLQKCIIKIKCKSVNGSIERRNKSTYAKKVREAFQLNKPELVFIMNADFLDSETIDYMRCHSTVAIWLFDNISMMPKCIDNLKHCSHIFSFDKNDINKLSSYGIEADFLPQACDVTIYKPLAEREKDIDILFVGNLYYYPNRQQTIRKIIDSFPNCRIKVIGEYKPWYKGLIKSLLREKRSIYSNHNVSPKNVNKYYNRSRIVLNIHRKDQENGANPRLFEICGSGAYQISNSNPFIESIFPNGEIGLYKTDDDLIDVISSALANDKSENAKKAHAIVMQQHTYENRVQQMIDMLVHEIKSNKD